MSGWGIGSYMYVIPTTQFRPISVPDYIWGRFPIHIHF